MKILGIDPGLASCGWAIVEAGVRSQRTEDRLLDKNYKLVGYGVINTNKEKNIPYRLNEIFVQLKKIVSDYKPNIVSIESQFYSKIAKNIVNTYLATGVVYLICGMLNLKLYEFSAKTIKSAITGYGAASKSQLKKMITLLLNLEKKINSEHINDAISVALCFLNMNTNINL